MGIQSLGGSTSTSPATSRGCLTAYCMQTNTPNECPTSTWGGLKGALAVTASSPSTVRSKVVAAADASRQAKPARWYAHVLAKDATASCTRVQLRDDVASADSKMTAGVPLPRQTT